MFPKVSNSILALLLGFVLAPVSTQAQTLIEALSEDERFDKLRGLLRQTEYGAVHRPFTLFAPTDEAFDKLPKSLIERLEDHHDKTVLPRLLDLHVVPGEAYREKAFPARMRAASGQRLVARYRDGALTIGPAISGDNGDVDRVETTRRSREARVLTGGFAVDNSRVYAIDRVLLTPNFEIQSAESAGQSPSSRDRPSETTGSSAAMRRRPSDSAAKELAETDSGTAGDIIPQDVWTQDFKTDLPQAPEPVPDAFGVLSLSTDDFADQDKNSLSLTKLLDRKVRTREGALVGTVSDMIVSLETATIRRLVVRLEPASFEDGADEIRRFDIRDVEVDPANGTLIVPAEQN